MRAWVSLLSEPAGTLGRLVDRLDGVAHGFHLHVGAGDLLGPELVRAVDARATRSVLDVLLDLDDAAAQVDAYAAAGADVVTVPVAQAGDALPRIAAWHVRGGLSVAAGDDLDACAHHVRAADRVLVCGGADPCATEATARRLVELGAAEVVVDGCLRLRALARAGVDGVVVGAPVLARAGTETAIANLRWAGRVQPVG